MRTLDDIKSRVLAGVERYNSSTTPGKRIVRIDLFGSYANDIPSRDAFDANEMLKRASAMAAINIGELAKHLSGEFHAEFPGNELRMAARARDVYARPPCEHVPCARLWRARASTVRRAVELSRGSISLCSS